MRGPLAGSKLSMLAGFAEWYDIAACSNGLPILKQMSS